MAQPTCTNTLLLGVLLSLLRGLPLLPRPLVPLLSPSLSKRFKRLELLLLILDRPRCLGLVPTGDTRHLTRKVCGQVVALHTSARSCYAKVSYSCITTLGLADLAGENDETGPVLLKTIDVHLLPLLGLAPPAVVHGDAESFGLLPPDTRLLQLGKGETAALFASSVDISQTMEEGAYS